MSRRRPTDPPLRSFLADGATDDLARGLIALMREFWVLADRQTVLETLLESHGVTPDQIDAFQPDAAVAARLDARREAMIDRVMGAMGAGPDDPEAPVPAAE